MGKLTAFSVKALCEPGRHGDGDGLYLHVAPSGTKSWVQRIVINEKRRDIGLGSYPTVSLAQARSLAAANRSAVSEGRDPLAERRIAKDAARTPTPSVPTFAEAAAKVIELRRPTWRNPKHAAQWGSTLATYAFPVMGRKPVDAITPHDALAVLEPIWTVKNETATRVRQRMETVMDWAVTHGYRLDNPAGKALLKVLPAFKREREHHPSLPYYQVGWAVAQVRESTSNLLTKLAFEFLVLTAARSGEVRKANWGEILWHRRTLGDSGLQDEGWADPPGPFVRQGHGDPERSLADIRTGRAGIPFQTWWQGNVRHDPYRPVAPVGSSSRAPRISEILQELGRGTHERMGGGGRGCPCPPGQEQDRGRLLDHRSVR